MMIHVIDVTHHVAGAFLISIKDVQVVQLHINRQMYMDIVNVYLDIILIKIMTALDAILHVGHVLENQIA
jgi:hypothetical protein